VPADLQALGVARTTVGIARRAKRGADAAAALTGE
jgi:hypothetical protein